jgi:hypothetical protein
LASCAVSTHGSQLFADDDDSGTSPGGEGGAAGVDTLVSESGGSAALAGSFGVVGGGGRRSVDGSVPSSTSDGGTGGSSGVGGAGGSPHIDTGPPKFPLKASANGRYLTDQNGAPFLVAGDAPQALMAKLTTSEMANYFTTRSRQGFNAAWVNLLCNAYTGGTDDAITIDGIAPFSGKLGGEYDLSTPNPAYFSRVDAAVGAAAKAGIVIFLNPIETLGFLTTLQTNGAASARAYGQYLGQRYANSDNIVWLHGNSFSDWRTPETNVLVQMVALGIKDKDTRHLQTIELDDSSSSLDDVAWSSPSPILGINSIYAVNPTYARLYKDYNRAAFLPNLIVETQYEGAPGGSHDTNAHDCRAQSYWADLSGATGSFYGSQFVWNFGPGWSAHMNDGGAAQVQHLRALFSSRAWQNLVPDQAHTVVVSGFGTFSDFAAQDNTYATTARAADGSLIMTYMPTPRAITVDLTKLSGSAVGRWYDPTTGAFTTIDGSPFAASGSKSFTPPSTKHGDGYADWILVLETAPPP